MNLNQFKSWKLLYEDNELCFSKAVNYMDQSNVFFITLFSPDKLSIATKHLLEDHLHNYVALIEEDDKLHLILKSQEGRPIKKFISKTPLDYDDRVQIVYEYFKLIEKYDAFPNAIKIQLLDEEQLLISDDGLLFRELIDYTPLQSYTDRDVFKQLGKTIDIILHDAEGYHSQFIDNLRLGNHSFKNLHASKENFKDIFIFEKPDALESINYEYTIIINDLEAGPPIKLADKDLEAIKAQDHVKIFDIKDSEIINPIVDSHFPHEELQRELAALLSAESLSGSVENINEIKAEDNVDNDTEVIDMTEDETSVDDRIEVEDETVDETEDDVEPANAPIEIAASKLEDNSIDTLFTVAENKSIPYDTKSFKAQFKEDDLMPEVLPKSQKQRFVEENDETIHDEDMALIFDESNDSKVTPTRRFWILAIVGVLLITALGFWGVKTLFSSEPIIASFEVEALHDNRIAFMNTSTGDKKIENFSWEIYYADTLVQTFTDENLFPVFDTEGSYKIVLKVQDKKGVWSEPYTEVYEFKFTEETTTP